MALQSFTPREFHGSLEQEAPTPNFLSLPRELRDLIYEHTLLQRDSIITMLNNRSCYRDTIDARPPSICAVNQQIRCETLPIFYNINVFSAQLDSAYDLVIAKGWLTAITDANVAHLRKLTMSGWARVPFGHMIAKRWISCKFDLKDGRMEIESEYGQCAGAIGPQHRFLEVEIDELKCKFKDLVNGRAGEVFNGAGVAMLMEGFNGMCSGY